LHRAKTQSHIEAAAATASSAAWKNVCPAGRALVRSAFRMSEHLRPLVAKISARLAIKPEIFIMHPAELRLLHSLTDAQLREFAAEHGWRVVRRLGGRQIEFYNDAGVRLANESEI
jgi:hypothetical protein